MWKRPKCTPNCFVLFQWKQTISRKLGLILARSRYNLCAKTFDFKGLNSTKRISISANSLDNWSLLSSSSREITRIMPLGIRIHHWIRSSCCWYTIIAFADLGNNGQRSSVRKPSGARRSSFGCFQRPSKLVSVQGHRPR